MGCGAQSNPEIIIIDATSSGVNMSEIIGTVPITTTINAFCMNDANFTTSSKNGKFTLAVPTNEICYMTTEHKLFDDDKIYTSVLTFVTDRGISKKFRVISESITLELLDLVLTKENIESSNTGAIEDLLVLVIIEEGEVLALLPEDR